MIEVQSDAFGIVACVILLITRKGVTSLCVQLLRLFIGIKMGSDL